MNSNDTYTSKLDNIKVYQNAVYCKQKKNRLEKQNIVKKKKMIPCMSSSSLRILWPETSDHCLVLLLCLLSCQTILAALK